MSNNDTSKMDVSEYQQVFKFLKELVSISFLTQGLSHEEVLNQFLAEAM
jgi:hypothetical protein